MSVSSAADRSPAALKAFAYVLIPGLPVTVAPS